MAKHRQRDADVLLTVGQYEQLITVLHHHRPGERFGLCLVCGIGWPCIEVRLHLEDGQLNGQLP